MRKMMSLVILLVIVMASVGPGMASAETGWQCPAGFEGQTLRIFSWADDVANTTIPDFEAACGVTVEVFEYGSSDAMLTTMQTESAQYDLIVGTGAMARTLVDMGLIQPLDYALLPNLEKVTLDPATQFMKMRLDYSMAYQSLTIGIAYDKNQVSEPITSWEQFFAYDGRVAWVDDSTMMLGIANYVLDHFVASFDEAEIAAAADFLLNQTQNDVFAVASNTQSDLLLQGEVDAIIDSSRNVVDMIRDCECDDYTFTIADDGLMISYDVMSVPSNAQNVALAHAYIDYILEPQVNADLSSALGSAAVVVEAYPLVDEDIYNNGISYLTFDMIMPFLGDFQNMEEMDGMEHLPETMQLYVSTWNNVKAELASR